MCPDRTFSKLASWIELRKLLEAGQFADEECPLSRLDSLEAEQLLLSAI